MTVVHRRQWPVLAVGLVLSLFAPLTALGQVPGIDSEEQAFFKWLNDYRASKGLPPLALSPALSRAADAHSRWMADHNCFSHQCSGEADYVQRMWDAGYPNVATGYGENIFAGGATAAEAFDAWKKSTGHNKNMLHSAWRAVGVARAYNGAATYGWYWTTDFSTLDDTSPIQSGELGILDNPNLMVPASQTFSYWFRADGGMAPYTWSVKGKLPSGLRFRSCGELKGKTTKVGTYTINVSVKDKLGKKSQKSFTLKVHQFANGSMQLSVEPTTTPVTQLSILDLAGRLLVHEPRASVSLRVQELRELTQQLADGVYLALVTSRHSTGALRRELKKIIVQR
jgi:hypothetical protein